MAFGRYVPAIAGLAAVVAALTATVYLIRPADQAGPDLSRSKPSQHGLFMVSIRPESGVIQQDTMHSWLLTLKTPSGKPVENAAIDISGGMPPRHQGLPTSPQAGGYLGGGHYRIDGLKFTANGQWQLHFAIYAAAGSDAVVFNVMR